ncbi:MAG: hypothetical protein COB12_07980 [Flavobacterium sp.]|nr:MAG: hypothetical protein COB12_07980 [Flavobacterium sp.]
MNLLYFIFPLLFISCNSSDDPVISDEIEIIETTEQAEVVSISVSGNENSYNFSVGILSPDTGCEQYANWWEIISEDGSELIYRRILGHSHVNEQPFVRSGGLVEISANQTVIIRAHMNTSSFGIKVYKGTVASDFSAFTLDDNFAINLELQDPLPTGCAF